MNEYKERVVEYRRKHKITQDEMAKLCGLSRATINHIETRERYFVQVKTQAKLDMILKEEQK